MSSGASSLAAEAARAVEVAHARLEQAVAALPTDEPCLGLQAVADELPIALSVDLVNLRLLGSDDQLHLVAASGCATIEIRRRAMRPLPVRQIRRMLEDGGHDAVAVSLGITWIETALLTAEGQDLGLLAVGSRTRRRPGEAQRAALRAVAKASAARLLSIDRVAERLERCSLRLARNWLPPDWPAEGPVAELRPRERAILELFADGLSTSDIATLLVISPHTVRTHVKLALRRLGVHSRDEAATMVRSDQLSQLV